LIAASYMLLRSDTPAAKNREILKFLAYGLHEGRAAAAGLNYVPLPDRIVRRIEAAWTAKLHAWP